MTQHIWHLVSATTSARESAHFEIPGFFERHTLRPGDIAKLIFEAEQPFSQDSAMQAERMWVIVQKRSIGGYVGKLDNDPIYFNSLKAGDTIIFKPRHICDIWRDDH